MGEKILRKPGMKEKFGVKSNTTIDTWEKTLPGFPKRRRIAGGVVGWIESEVDDWIRSRPVAGGRVPVEAIEARR